jgi:hypothetical protein
MARLAQMLAVECGPVPFPGVARMIVTCIQIVTCVGIAAYAPISGDCDQLC